MLQGINKLGRSWVGRVIVTLMFSFLIASFALWGINDIFRGTSRTQVATVGGVDITADAYRNAYQIEYQNLIRRTRRPITPEQARALGLEQQVLSRLISEAAYDHEVREFGLSVSDAVVIRAIRADPTFRGPSGEFDQSRFAGLLRDAGLSEAQYIRDQRALMARQEISEGLSGGLRVPLAMREAVHRFSAEHRSADFIRLGVAALGPMPVATQTQLGAFFEERKASYRAPEYRALRLLKLDADAIARPDSVSDDDARAYYVRVKDTRFGSPERRAIQQILFAGKADAEAAAERIRGGTSFEDFAREQKVDEATLNLGNLTRGDVLDPAVADTAFGLAAGIVSAPIETRFGTALIRVTAIEAGSLKPFEAVAAEVKRDLARDRARAQLPAVRDSIEDDRAGAKPLEAIARDRKLPLLTIAAVDREGRDKTGVADPNLPNPESLLPGAFRSEIGADNEAVTTRDGGYVWFDVTAIEPARDRPLSEVSQRVGEDWRKAEISQALAEKGRVLAARLDAGEMPAVIATEFGLTVVNASELTRNNAHDDIPALVVNRVFATPVGKSASAAVDDENRILFRVDGAVVPPFVTTTQDSVATEEQLRTLAGDDILSEYVNDVRKRIGVQLYPANIRRAIGGGDS